MAVIWNDQKKSSGVQWEEPVEKPSIPQFPDLTSLYPPAPEVSTPDVQAQKVPAPRSQPLFTSPNAERVGRQMLDLPGLPDITPMTQETDPIPSLGRTGEILREGARQVPGHFLSGFSLLADTGEPLPEESRALIEATIPEAAGFAFQGPKEAEEYRRLLHQTPWLQSPEDFKPPEGLWENLIYQVPQFGAQVASSAMTPALGTLYMFGQIAGRQYDEMLQGGMDKDRAAAYAYANAAIQLPMEQIGMGKILGKWAPGGAMKVIKDWAERSTTEAVTEFLQKFPEEITWLMATSPHTASGQLAKEIFQSMPEWAWEGLTLDAPIGGILGGFASAPGAMYAIAHEADIERYRSQVQRAKNLAKTSRDVKIEKAVSLMDAIEKEIANNPKLASAPWEAYHNMEKQLKLPPGQGYVLAGEHSRWSPELAQALANGDLKLLPEGQGFILYDQKVELAPTDMPFSPELAAKLKKLADTKQLPPGQGFVIAGKHVRFSPELAELLLLARTRKALPPGQAWSIVEEEKLPMEQKELPFTPEPTQEGMVTDLVKTYPDASVGEIYRRAKMKDRTLSRDDVNKMIRKAKGLPVKEAKQAKAAQQVAPETKLAKGVTMGNIMAKVSGGQDVKSDLENIYRELGEEKFIDTMNDQKVYSRIVKEYEKAGFDNKSARAEAKKFMDPYKKAYDKVVSEQKAAKAQEEKKKAAEPVVQEKRTEPKVEQKKPKPAKKEAKSWHEMSKEELVAEMDALLGDSIVTNEDIKRVQKEGYGLKKPPSKMSKAEIVKMLQETYNSDDNPDLAVPEKKEVPKQEKPKKQEKPAPKPQAAEVQETFYGKKNKEGKFIPAKQFTTGTRVVWDGDEGTVVEPVKTDIDPMTQRYVKLDDDGELYAAPVGDLELLTPKKKKLRTEVQAVKNIQKLERAARQAEEEVAKAQEVIEQAEARLKPGEVVTRKRGPVTEVEPAEARPKLPMPHDKVRTKEVTDYTPVQVVSAYMENMLDNGNDYDLDFIDSNDIKTWSDWFSVAVGGAFDWTESQDWYQAGWDGDKREKILQVKDTQFNKKLKDHVTNNIITTRKAILERALGGKKKKLDKKIKQKQLVDMDMIKSNIKELREHPFREGHQTQRIWKDFHKRLRKYLNAWKIEDAEVLESGFESLMYAGNTTQAIIIAEEAMSALHNKASQMGVKIMSAGLQLIKTNQVKTYESRGKDNLNNILIRPGKKKAKTLLVQISDLATPEHSSAVDTAPYFDELYGKDDYNRPDDFWEIPTWIAEVASFDKDVDVLVVRNIVELLDTLNTEGYKNVLFSVLDSNKEIVKQVANNYSGNIIAGGYIDSKFFANNRNVTWIDSMEKLAKKLKRKYKYGTDYRHFRGTDTVPRLCLSSGCLHYCAFCVVPKKLSMVSSRDIDAQIEAMKDLKFKTVYINDKTFGQAENFDKLTNIYQRIKEFNPDFEGFIIQTTAPALNKISDQFLRNAGIKYVELGVETFNDDILAKIKKPHRTKQLNEAVQKLRDNNIGFIPNILVGLAGKNKDGSVWSETKETYQNTLDFLKANDDIISHVNVYNLALYEGTELEEQLKTKIDTDYDENSTEKSWQKDKEVHTNFYKDVVEFAREQLKKDIPGKEVSLIRFMRTPGLVKITPGDMAHRTDIAGAEKKRLVDDPDVPARVHYYIEGGIYEQNVEALPHVYRAKIPANRLYDTKADPLNLRTKAVREGMGTVDINLAEKMMSDAGYVGYTTQRGELAPSTVVIFDELSVQEITKPEADQVKPAMRNTAKFRGDTFIKAGVKISSDEMRAYKLKVMRVMKKLYPNAEIRNIKVPEMRMEVLLPNGAEIEINLMPVPVDIVISCLGERASEYTLEQLENKAAGAVHVSTPGPVTGHAIMWLAGLNIETMAHEVFHTAAKIALTPREYARLMNKYMMQIGVDKDGNVTDASWADAEELAAEDYAQWIKGRLQVEHKLFFKIKEFFKKIARMFGWDKEGAIFEAIRSGEVWQKPLDRATGSVLRRIIGDANLAKIRKDAGLKGDLKKETNQWIQRGAAMMAWGTTGKAWKTAMTEALRNTYDDKLVTKELVNRLHKESSEWFKAMAKETVEGKLPTAQQVTQMLNRGAEEGGLIWYDEVDGLSFLVQTDEGIVLKSAKQELIELFGEEGGYKLAGLISLMSKSTNVVDNVDKALDVYLAYQTVGAENITMVDRWMMVKNKKTGKPEKKHFKRLFNRVTGQDIVTTHSVTAYAIDEYMTSKVTPEKGLRPFTKGDKIINFLDAIWGKADAVVVDRWMGRVINFPHKVKTAKGKDKTRMPLPDEREFIKEWIRQGAQTHGVSARAFQAWTWVGKKTLDEEASGKPTGTVEPLQKVINEKIGRRYGEYVEGAEGTLDIFKKDGDKYTMIKHDKGYTMDKNYVVRLDKAPEGFMFASLMDAMSKGANTVYLPQSMLTAAHTLGFRSTDKKVDGLWEMKYLLKNVRELPTIREKLFNYYKMVDKEKVEKQKQKAMGQRDAALQLVDRQIQDSETIVNDSIDDIFGTKKKSLGQKLKDGWNSFTFVTQVFDEFAPIKDFLGDRVYKLHRMLNGVHASIEALMRHGKLTITEDGVLTTDTRDKGFAHWVKRYEEDAINVLRWAAAKRSEQLELDNPDWVQNEEFLTQSKREIIYREIGERPKSGRTWEELYAEFQEFHNSVLDIAHAAGIISESQKADWHQLIYVPFYRVFEDVSLREEYMKHPQKAKQIAAKMKRIKGSKKKIGEPIENVVANWAYLIQESMRNQARAEAYTMGRMLDDWVDLIREVDYQEITHMTQDRNGVFSYETKSGDKNVLSFMENGKRKYFAVNDVELYNALTTMNAAQFGKLFNWAFGTPKRWLTYGATFGPAFRVANAVRDTVHTWMITPGFKFTPFLDTAKGFISAMREDEKYVRALAAGALHGGSYVHAQDPARLDDFTKRLLKQEEKWNVINTPRKLLELWEKIGAASENAARIQLHHTLSQESTLEAAFQGRDLLDFALKGQHRAVMAAVRMIPFLGARMQGNYRLYRAAIDPKTRLSFAIKGVILAAASLAIWAAFRDDERYKELEDWEKWTYYHIFIGPGEKGHIRIPKPFEVGAIFSSMFESIANVMSGEEEIDFLVDFFKFTGRETFAIGVPQTFKPLAEVWANKSFFTGRPLESQSLQRLQPGARSEPWDSEFLKVVGETTNMSPKKMQAIIRGYGATVGMIGLGAADRLTRWIGDFPEKPTVRINEYPLVGRFWREGPARNTKELNRVYELMDEVDKLSSTITHYMNLGDLDKARKLMESDPKKYALKTGLAQLRTQLGDLRKYMKQVESHPKMSAEEKRTRIDKAMRRRNELVARAYKHYSSYLEK